MNGSDDLRVDQKTQAAIAELKTLIASRYPTATFELSPGVDEPGNIHLVTTVDLDEPTDVLDLVIDRAVDFQADEGVPVHVIPVRTPERVLAESAKRERKRSGAAGGMSSPEAMVKRWGLGAARAVAPPPAPARRPGPSRRAPTATPPRSRDTLLA
jgi:hypothetical protein